ncbi:nucleotidyltransferase family protein [Mesorhizobium sp. BAC0120]|nr:nucleotidyltransferase family protein [Mesorhizobium sp. BAC0120]MDW6023908.1 nucleotidyltransferase family protein [Mesorhizobium sp. BAC0120]
MKPSEALSRHRDEVLEVIGRYPVSNPRVFGSTARGEDTDDSDLDILVDRAGVLTYFDLARLEIELEQLLGVPVGVHTPGEFRQAMMARIEADRRAL